MSIREQLLLVFASNCGSFNLWICRIREVPLRPSDSMSIFYKGGTSLKHHVLDQAASYVTPDLEPMTDSPRHCSHLHVTCSSGRGSLRKSRFWACFHFPHRTHLEDGASEVNLGSVSCSPRGVVKSQLLRSFGILQGRGITLWSSSLEVHFLDLNFCCFSSTGLPRLTMGTPSRKGMAWRADEPQRVFRLTCDVYFLCINRSGIGQE